MAREQCRNQRREVRREKTCSTDIKFLFTQIELLLAVDKQLLHGYFETQNSKPEHFEESSA